MYDFDEGEYRTRERGRIAHTFPESVRRFRRDDGHLDLAYEGYFPSDLRGFVYIIGPVGKEGRSLDVDTPFLNGDGTLYRIALDGTTPELTWRMLRPTCFWAEHLADTLPEHADKRFHDLGIARVSADASIGGRNMLNTALQAVRFGDGSERLLVTYESGRPHEVDPASLRLVTPLGKREAWLPTLFPESPFALVSATSHPAFDPTRGRVYMMNFVRGWKTYRDRALRALQSPGWPGWSAARWRSLGRRLAKPAVSVAASAMRKVAGKEATEPPRRRRERLGVLDSIGKARIALGRAWSRASHIRGGTLLPRPASQLLVWDGRSEPRAVPVVGSNGEPLVFLESAHQMVMTEHHVLVIDASFKFELDLVTPELDDDLHPWVVRTLRRRLSRRQPQEVPLHIIPVASIDAVLDGTEEKAHAQTVTLAASVVHCFADYDDAGGARVTLYCIDNAGSDSSEFLVESDLSEFGGGPLSPEVLGMMPAGTDIDRVVRFEIELRSGRVTGVHRTSEVADEEVMWTIALASGPGIAMSVPPKRVGPLFFYTHGLMPRAMSELVWDLYCDSPRRKLTAKDVRRRAEAGGTPARLVRYDTGTAPSAADSYTMEPGWLLLSPQWAPSTRSDHPGYVVAAAFGPAGPDDKAIWIFDAGAVASGPICRLRPGVPGTSLPWGYIVHSTYLAEARPSPAPYRVSARADLERWIDEPLVAAVIDAVERER